MRGWESCSTGGARSARVKGAEVTSTIRVHCWISSGSVIPLPPVFARSGSGERRLSRRNFSEGGHFSPCNVNAASFDSACHLRWETSHTYTFFKAGSTPNASTRDVQVIFASD